MTFLLAHTDDLLAHTADALFAGSIGALLAFVGLFGMHRSES